MCWESKDTLSCRKENLTHKPWHVLLPSKCVCVLNAVTRNGPHRQGILENINSGLLCLKYAVHYTLYFNHDLFFCILVLHTSSCEYHLSLSLSLCSILSSNWKLILNIQGEFAVEICLFRFVIVHFFFENHLKQKNFIWCVYKN